MLVLSYVLESFFDFTTIAVIVRNHDMFNVMKPILRKAIHGYLARALLVLTLTGSPEILVWH